MRRLLLLPLMLLCLSSCHVEGGEDDGSLSVVAVDFPSYDACRAVLGSTDGLVMLLPPGTESHSYDPTARDMVRLSEADLVVLTGGPSDEWVEALISTLDAPPVLFRLVDQVSLLEEERREGMEEEEEHGHSHDHDFQMDEHVWTSPSNEIAIIRGLSATLSSIDPEHEERYEACSAKYIAELESLDEEFRAIVEEAPLHTLIFASRFPLLYFVREYGLDYYAAFPGCAEESEPSARTVAFLIDKARELDVPCVLNIELSSELLARTIAEEAGVPVRTFYSMHNASALDFAQGATYVSIMERNIDVLKEALGGSDNRQ